MNHCEMLEMQNLMRAGTLLALAFVAGCGDKGATLSGKVTYNGQPVELGTIAFRPTDGRGQVFAGDIKDGVYTITGAQAGQRRVEIRGLRAFERSHSQADAAKAAAEAQAAGNVDPNGLVNPQDYIPENAEGNYKDVEVPAGDGTLDFAITGPPRKD